MAARRQSRIDHAVLHGVFYMHISLPIPLAGSRSRVKLRRSRRPDHSSSKSSHALLGTSDPGQYPFFIPRSSAIRGRLISPVTSAAAKPTPITSGIQESHLVLVRPGNWKIIEALPDKPSLCSLFLLLLFFFFSLLSSPLLTEFPVGMSRIREERYKFVGAISDPGKNQERNETSLLRAVKRLIDVGGGVD